LSSDDDSDQAIDVGGILYHERLTKTLSRIFQVNKVLYAGRTKYQRVEVVDTPDFGKMLILDGKVQFSLKDEFIYHESLVHPVMLTHPSPEEILIIGGGDGGALKEVLKHNTVKNVTLVDLDEEVMKIVKKYVPEMFKDSLEDSRVKISNMDGRKFLAETENKYDIIIVDVTDPFGPSTLLYTKEFYQLVSNTLKDGGAMVTHSEGMFSCRKEFVTIYRTIETVFRKVRACSAFIPSFGDVWMFTIGSNTLDPVNMDVKVIEERMKKRHVETRFYYPEIHRALFTLPKDLLKDLKEMKVEISTDKSPVQISA